MPPVQGYPAAGAPAYPPAASYPAAPAYPPAGAYPAPPAYSSAPVPAPYASASAPPPQRSEVFYAKVPKGVEGGQTFETKTPAGRTVTVTAPSGAREGMEFQANA